MRNRLLILSAMALLLPIVPALACFPDADTDEILFAPALRGHTTTPTSIEDCQANGLNPGSYFDNKGRIVGSPCDPVEYCSDRSSTDIAVIDYCSDSWNEQQSEAKPEKDFCEKHPEVVPCNPNDAFPMIPGPGPGPELGECSHDGDGLDVCQPIEQDNHEGETAEESEDEPTVEDEEENE